MAPNARRRRAPVIRRRKRMPDSGDARFPRQRRFTRFLKLSNQTSSRSKVRWVELVAGPCNDRNRTDRDHRPGTIPRADFEAIY
jgi:hypothetical protein